MFLTPLVLNSLQKRLKSWEKCQVPPPRDSGFIGVEYSLGMILYNTLGDLSGQSNQRANQLDIPQWEPIFPNIIDMVWTKFGLCANIDV